jgi:hypothetical protein
MHMQMQVTLLLVMLCQSPRRDNDQKSTMEGSEGWTEWAPFDRIKVRAGSSRSSFRCKEQVRGLRGKLSHCRKLPEPK